MPRHTSYNSCVVVNMRPFRGGRTHITRIHGILSWCLSLDVLRYKMLSSGSLLIPRVYTPQVYADYMHMYLYEALCNTSKRWRHDARGAASRFK